MQPAVTDDALARAMQACVIAGLVREIEAEHVCLDRAERQDEAAAALLEALLPQNRPEQTDGALDA